MNAKKSAWTEAAMDSLEDIRRAEVPPALDRKILAAHNKAQREKVSDMSPRTGWRIAAALLFVTLVNVLLVLNLRARRTPEREVEIRLLVKTLLVDDLSTTSK